MSSETAWEVSATLDTIQEIETSVLRSAIQVIRRRVEEAGFGVTGKPYHIIYQIKEGKSAHSIHDDCR